MERRKEDRKKTGKMERKREEDEKKMERKRKEDRKLWEKQKHPASAVK
ncbi:hypothetical protein [Methanosarcina mazei]|nr:hypothetical protein [Methanosarcina mazei]